MFCVYYRNPFLNEKNSINVTLFVVLIVESTSTFPFPPLSSVNIGCEFLADNFRVKVTIHMDVANVEVNRATFGEMNRTQ